MLFFEKEGGEIGEDEIGAPSLPLWFHFCFQLNTKKRLPVWRAS